MADTSAAEKQIAADPEFQRVMAEIQQMNAPIARGGGGGVWQGSQAYADLMALNQKYQQSGLLPKGYSVNFAGEVGQGDFMSRHAGALSLISLIPAGLGIGLAAAGGGAATSALPSAATTGTTGALAPALAPSLTIPTADASAALASGAGAGGTVAGTTGAVAPAVTTAIKGSSLLHDLLPSIISGGSAVAGTALASHANTEAAKIAAAQADKALAVQQQQYALQRQDTAPYRALGQGAVNNLGFLGGIDTTSNLKALSDINPTVNPPPSTGVAPGAVDASGKSIPGAPPTSSITPPTMAQQQTNNTTLSQVGSGGTVRIQDPATGMVHLIPQSQAAAAQQAGGRLV